MRPMVPQDVYELTSAGDPRISPDGSTAAYVVSRVDEEANGYASAIFLAPLDGKEAPRRFTSGAKVDASPRWSPDGRHLAFVSNRRDQGDPERGAQLYVIPVEGGEARRLTDFGPEGVSAIAWSPDGGRIAFTVRVRDDAYDEPDDAKRAPRRFTRLRYKLDDVGWTGDRRAHVFVVDADGSSEPVRVTDGDSEHASPTWSPDGTRLAFTAARHDDWDLDTASDVWVVDASGGEPEKLTATDGTCSLPSWSPDGRSIAFLYEPGVLDAPRHTRVAVVDVETNERRVLSEELDRDCAPFPALREPVWHAGDVVFAVEDHGNTHLYRAPADGSGRPELLVGGDRRVTGFDVADGVVVFSATDPTRPAEIHVGDVRLSDATDAFTASRTLASPEPFVAVSPDGAEVEAWVMRPAGFEETRRYPVLLSIHGGPFTQYGNGFFDEFQVYAGAGYAVVYANPRGSSGYSEEWGRAIRGTTNGGPGWGTRDYEDLMAVVDTALQRFGFLDPDRLGVLGGSYGGYMTSWIVAHTDRFKAACSERAVNYWPSMYGSSDYGWPFKSWIGSYLFEDPEAWIRMSPAVYAERIRTPLLILHSEDDLRCPIEQAEHLFTTLRLLKRDVEFVRFPAESHELSRSGSPAHRVMRFEVILEWFGRHLGPV